MTDQKPKHKPQKKRALEEVLKSLQDLIRTDLVSRTPLHQSWRESGRTGPGPRTAASEPESFQSALSKLDRIINEKIIEPVERAQQTPLEPLYPDEELEIEWSDAIEPDGVAGKEQAEIEPADVAALDGALISLDQEIEIEPMEPDAAPPSQVAAEPEAGTAPDQVESEPNTDVFSEPVESEPIVEELEATSVESVQKPAADSIEIQTVISVEAATPATIGLPEMQEPAEVADDHQQAFSFTTAATARAAEPGPEPRLEPAPSPEVRHEIKEEPKVPRAAEVSAYASTRGPDDTGSGDSPDTANELARKSDTPLEQAEARAVESNGAADTDAFTVEFSVEPKTPPASAAMDKETPDSADQGKPGADDAKPRSEKTDVKKKPRPADSTEAAKKSSKRSIEEAGASKTAGAIPILEDVADLQAPPATPLPDTSQARDIAIRVIAKLNIERRKAGEAPLDIKTIERMKQYLADALSKRALNKPK